MSSSVNLAKIAVIGAGPSGLAVAKNLLEQGLTDFIVFEKSHTLGGNWLFNEHNNHSSVYETTHIISSKRLSSYEDFPMPADYPDYPSHRQLLAYFNQYALHFGIHEFIRFNSQVDAVMLLPNQQWQINYHDQIGHHQHIFDEVLVANGHHWDPIIPAYPGHFNGDMTHAHDYKKASYFKGKRVLVVGGGNSACDLAVEIARVSDSTGISIRRGQHIFPKFLFGKPTDVALAKIAWLPARLKQLVAAAVIRLIQGRYSKYHLTPPVDPPLAVHPTVNSELLYFIRHGKVRPYPGISCFAGNQVHFVDNRQAEFDHIIYATGYKVSFPFFDSKLIDFSALTYVPLYLKMLHPQFRHLYFIGLFQPQGCIWPLADYQAKIAARLIKGTLAYPSHILTKIEQERAIASTHFKSAIRHALEVDYHAFRRHLLKELAN